MKKNNTGNNNNNQNNPNNKKPIYNQELSEDEFTKLP